MVTCHSQSQAAVRQKSHFFPRLYVHSFPAPASVPGLVLLSGCEVTAPLCVLASTSIWLLRPSVCRVRSHGRGTVGRRCV